MKIDTFLMERMQSLWENVVAWNLSESGVHPLSVSELLDPSTLGPLELGYGHTAGSLPLRAAVAAMYPGAGCENVLITNGTAEANFIAAWHFGDRGTQPAMMVPNYMQLWGALEGFGGSVRPIRLRESSGKWRLHLDDLEPPLSAQPQVIAICNPNNPTGAILNDDEMDAICAMANRTGAWILADEVYRGAERNGSLTESFWGRSERVIVTGGLSKAYGLPGLRIGWVVGSPDIVQELWRYKDYTTIGASPLSERLAQEALGPEKRAWVLDRTRRIIREQYAVVEEWLRARSETFEWIPPEAGAFVYARYQLDIGSTDLVDRLRMEKGVLVVPGDHFGMGPYIRIGFGVNQHVLRNGLARLGELLDEIPSTPAPARP